MPSSSGLGLAKYKCPERVEIIDSFPLTRVGKLDKPALKKLHRRRAGRLKAAGTPAMTSTEYIVSELPLVVRRRVKWGECDPAGVVYTVSFSEYVISAAELFYGACRDARSAQGSRASARRAGRSTSISGSRCVPTTNSR